MEQAYVIRKTLLMTAAIATVAVPLLVSAAVKYDPDRATTIPYETSSAGTVQSPERLYERMKAVSREMCGSTDLLIVGSLQRIADNKACYEGTLEAAVDRLGDPTVTALHYKKVARL
jgi:UrcA family protein